MLQVNASPVEARKCEATPAKMEGKAAKEAARKLAAQWKRQLKLLRAKDVDKKREGLRLAAADARFFREQPEALPALLALLTRLKVRFPSAFLLRVRAYPEQSLVLAVAAATDARDRAGSARDPRSALDYAGKQHPRDRIPGWPGS